MKTFTIKLIESCLDCSFYKLEMVTKDILEEYRKKINGLKEDESIFFCYCTKEMQVIRDDNPRPKWCPLEGIINDKELNELPFKSLIEYLKDSNLISSELSYPIGRLKDAVPNKPKTKFNFILESR